MDSYDPTRIIIQHQQTIVSMNRKNNLFLITRFNLKLYSHDKNNRKTLSKEWLDERFYLFEKYCLPSIKNQTYKDFLWICLFDQGTPDKYKKYISKYEETVPQFIPYYLRADETKNLISYLNNIIEYYAMKMPGPVIQIRLDNDDALQKDFLKGIIAKVNEQKDDLMIYSFKYGLQYYNQMNFAMQISYPNNHFLALINKNHASLHMNIFQFNHYLVIKEKRPFTCINNKCPMWLEVIHDSNVVNDVRMTLYQHFYNKTDLDDFGVKNIKLNRNITSKIQFMLHVIKQIIIHIKRKTKLPYFAK